MDHPENLYYTKDHEWALLKNDHVLVGITDHAQKELGEIIYLDIDTEGETISQNEVFGSIEAVKTVSDLFMPITGKIESVNKDLEDEPELVNADPYGKGWLIKIALQDDTKAQLETLLTPEDYKELVG